MYFGSDNLHWQLTFPIIPLLNFHYYMLFSFYFFGPIWLDWELGLGTKTNWSMLMYTDNFFSYVLHQSIPSWSFSLHKELIQTNGLTKGPTNQLTDGQSEILWGRGQTYFVSDNLHWQLTFPIIPLLNFHYYMLYSFYFLVPFG